MLDLMSAGEEAWNNARCSACDEKLNKRGQRSAARGIVLYSNNISRIRECRQELPQG